MTILYIMGLMFIMMQMMNVGLAPRCLQCGGKIEHKEDCPLNKD